MNVGQYWSNFLCSINGVKERLHWVLGQIGSKLVVMATKSSYWLIMGEKSLWSHLPRLLKKAMNDILYGIVLLFIIGSLWNLQITWAGIKPYMCSKFSQSGLFTMELPALIAAKTIFDLLGMLDSGERLLSFGWLVCQNWSDSSMFFYSNATDFTAIKASFLRLLWKSQQSLQGRILVFIRGHNIESIWRFLMVGNLSDSIFEILSIWSNVNVLVNYCSG